MGRIARAFCIAPVVVALAMLAACDSDESSVAVSEQPVAPDVETVQVADPEQEAVSAEPVIASVNGDPVTQRELDVETLQLTGDAEFDRLDPDVKVQVLDAVMARRAIARTMEDQLSADRLAQIEVEARAYRENLLMKAYLQENARPERVTEEMVQTWYQNYPGKVRSEPTTTFHNGVAR